MNRTMFASSILLVLMVTVIIPPTNGSDDVIRFAVIGDRTGGHVPGVYEKILDRVESMKPEFAITVGDQIEGYNDDIDMIDAQWAEYDSIASVLSMPLFFTVGNHEIWSDISYDHYRETRGETYYSLNWGSLHLVVLDNGRYNSTSDFASEQLDWLAADLPKYSGGYRLIVFMHKPFWFDTIEEGKPDTLHSLFVANGVEAVFTGHYHSYFSGEYDGIKYTSLGSSGGDASESPTGMHYHFAWVAVTDDEIDITPITLEGARAWDDMPASDLKFIDQIRYRGVVMDKPLSVSRDMTPSDTMISLRVVNLNDDLTLSDTIEWKCPENWTVSPLRRAFSLGPNEEIQLIFAPTNDGRLYPLPSLQTDYAYNENFKCHVERNLRVARSVDCYPADRVSVDGKLDEGCWKDPATRLFHQDGSMMQTDPVEFYFAYDSANIYLAARCEESKMDSLTSKATDHDASIFSEDCVGYFIQPDIDRGVAYQVYINPNAAVFDQKLIVAEDGYTDYYREWDGEYEVNTQRGDDFWTVEAAIPLSVLDAEVSPGMKWGINFRRKQARNNAAADWQTPIDYNPNTYGVLLLH
jgi:hypothetical protein